MPVIGTLEFHDIRTLGEFPPDDAVVDGLTEPDPYYAVASLHQAVVVATITGINGNSFIVTGIRNGIELDFTIPVGAGAWRLEQVVPQHRHLSVISAINYAAGYLPEGPIPSPVAAPGEVDCDAIAQLCYDLAKNQYDTDRATIGAPWAGISAGGGVGAVVGGSVGGIAGSVTGAGAGGTGLLGGAWGAIVGAITGGVVEYTGQQGIIDRRYDGAKRRCELCQLACNDTGEWTCD